MPTVKFHVLDLQAGEGPRLQQAMMAVEGVYGAVASCETGCLELDFEDDVVSLDDLIAAVAREGFTARVAG